MSNGWAAIVYGRTYHLDFRLITIPHDFTAIEISWAAQHIIATTKQARNLAGFPRWSLFKNHHHCVVGVTCTVKDLIGEPVKDDQGRPLYVFVGYVSQVKNQRIKLLSDLDCLDNFKPLYQEIEQVWRVKNYDLSSRSPSFSQYKPLAFAKLATASSSNLPRLNNYTQDPDKIYLWQNSPEQNRLLWQASAQASIPIATCLNIQGKVLHNSPFLNQSNTQAEKEFQIITRRIANQPSPQNSLNQNPPPANSSISQKISQRAKEDFDLTLQQAAKMAIASQELIHNFADWNHSPANELEQSSPTVCEPEFGFKVKKSNANDEQDWF